MTTATGKSLGRYDKAFYDGFTESSQRSAQISLEALFGMRRPASVVDIGCGVGAWLKTAFDLGAAEVRGFDGPWVDNSQLLIPPARFTRIDFEAAEWPDFGRADLAMSLEVAEHLSPETGRKLVQRLCACAPVVLFSAATPCQGGEGHQNEQWQSSWAALFRAQGYQASLALRRKIWDNPAVNFWYRQNAIVYFNPTLAPQLNESADLGQPLDVIHPQLYEIRVVKRARHGRLRRVIDALRMR